MFGYSDFSNSCVFIRHVYSQDDVYIQAGVSVEDPEYVIPNGLKRIEV